MAELDQALDALAIPTTLVLEERDSHARPSTPLRVRGSFMSPGELVYADVPPVLPELPADQMPNRLGLAHWLVDPENPLTARVTVNRLWGADIRSRARRDERGLRVTRFGGRPIPSFLIGWRRDSWPKGGARRR